MNVIARTGTRASVSARRLDAAVRSRHVRGSDNMFSRESSMLRGVLLAAAMLSTGVAVADVSVPIDPVRNCLDTASGYFPYGASAATSQIAVGTYMVYLRDNSMSCYYGNLSGSFNFKCHIDTVMLRGVNSFQAGWGLSVGNPVMVDVSTATVFNAFIIDTPCGDNSGRATLFFKGPL